MNRGPCRRILAFFPSRTVAQSPAPPKATGVKPAATPAVGVSDAAPRLLQSCRTNAAAADPAATRKLIDQYCVTCHNAKLKTANLLLAQLDLAHLGDHSEIGELVVRKLRAGLMPPTNLPRPDRATMDSLIEWMETELDRKAETHLPAPGLHRMNRTEYTNAIRDLLALEVDATKFLRCMDSTRRVRQPAAALTISPALMEAYLSAAGKISRLAIGDVNAPTQWVWDVPPDTAQNHHIEGLPFGTRGGIKFDHQFPADGDYTFNVKGVTGYFQAVLGGIGGERLEIIIDGEARAPVRLGQGDCQHHGSRTVDAEDPGQGGLHTVGVDVPRDDDIPGTELNRPFQRTMKHAGIDSGLHLYPHVGQVTVEGPHDAKGATITASRQKIFQVPRPRQGADEDACARRIITTLARQLPSSRDRGGDKRADAVLSSGSRRGWIRRRNRSRIAAHAGGSAVHLSWRTRAAIRWPGSRTRITDLELASRLSFFFWSSIPDDALLTVAASGRLREPAVLEQQVKRMLADPKSSALISNFTGSG